MVYFNILLRNSHISENPIFHRLNFKDCPLNDAFSKLILNIFNLRLKIWEWNFRYEKGGRQACRS